MAIYNVEWVWQESDQTRAQQKKGGWKANRIKEHHKQRFQARDLEHAKEIVDNELIVDFEKRFLKASPMLERSDRSWNKFVENPNPERVWSITNPKWTVRSFWQKDKMIVRISEEG